MQIKTCILKSVFSDSKSQPIADVYRWFPRSSKGAVINALLCRLFCANHKLVCHFQIPESEYICKVIADWIYWEGTG